MVVIRAFFVHGIVISVKTEIRNTNMALIFKNDISSGKLMALNKHPSRECSRLVLISQLSGLKQCGLRVLLKDKAYRSCREIEPETAILPTWTLRTKTMQVNKANYAYLHNNLHHTGDQ